MVFQNVNLFLEITETGSMLVGRHGTMAWLVVYNTRRDISTLDWVLRPILTVTTIVIIGNKN